MIRVLSKHIQGRLFLEGDINFFKKLSFFKIYLFLAVSALICGTWDLR